MNSKQFLNPTLKIVLSAIGMAVLGYYLMQSFLAREEFNQLILARAIAFALFAYFFIKTLIEVTGKR